MYILGSRVQALMSLLKVSAADLATFQAELATLNSERDQRGLIKKFLLASGPSFTQTQLMPSALLYN